MIDASRFVCYSERVRSGLDSVEFGAVEMTQVTASKSKQRGSTLAAVQSSLAELIGLPVARDVRSLGTFTDRYDRDPKDVRFWRWSIPPTPSDLADLCEMRRLLSLVIRDTLIVSDYQLALRMERDSGQFEEEVMRRSVVLDCLESVLKPGAKPGAADVGGVSYLGAHSLRSFSVSTFLSSDAVSIVPLVLTYQFQSLHTLSLSGADCLLPIEVFADCVRQSRSLCTLRLDQTTVTSFEYLPDRYKRSEHYQKSRWDALSFGGLHALAQAVENTRAPLRCIELSESEGWVQSDPMLDRALVALIAAIHCNRNVSASLERLALDRLTPGLPVISALVRWLVPIESVAAPSVVSAAAAASAAAGNSSTGGDARARARAPAIVNRPIPALQSLCLTDANFPRFAEGETIERQAMTDGDGTESGEPDETVATREMIESDCKSGLKELYRLLTFCRSNLTELDISGWYAPNITQTTVARALLPSADRMPTTTTTTTAGCSHQHQTTAGAGGTAAPGPFGGGNRTLRRLTLINRSSASDFDDSSDRSQSALFHALMYNQSLTSLVTHDLLSARDFSDDPSGYDPTELTYVQAVLQMQQNRSLTDWHFNISYRFTVPPALLHSVTSLLTHRRLCGKRITANWRRAALVIAFVRANHLSPFRHSVLALISSVMQLVGTGTSTDSGRGREAALATGIDPPIALINCDGFLGTAFAIQQTKSKSNAAAASNAPASGVGGMTSGQTFQSQPTIIDCFYHWKSSPKKRKTPPAAIAAPSAAINPKAVSSK